MRRLSRLAVVAASVLLLAGCGERKNDRTSSSSTSVATATNPTVNPTPRPTSGDVLVAALGDSITAGAPLYDPDPVVRDRIGASLNPESQYEYWYTAAHPRYRFRNCGVGGERTDEIARRLQACAKGAQILVVQGGTNDIAQGRPVTDAADNITSMIRVGKQLGLHVATVEVIPWNNGYPRAAPLVTQLNRLIGATAKAEGVPVFRWHAALDDPAAPGRMRKGLTQDGNHPTVAGYKLLAERMQLP
ncbi:MAG: GDSL-like Lipase/Acylhydrolase [Frankiales bacterium]|nr:GDSL-like Lipase/Acylhydrolase [Frankiales bacterium]MCW3016582.1 GDSL-like Lipase/Acylhydrolase [Solirubrobacterales bacterium]